jgi:prepilin-type N-terminal cleavage/methylation domain-containing protein
VILQMRRRLPHRGQRGFTLVEVLITIGLLGFIALAFFGFMSVAASSLVHADEQTVAESLARSQMEYVKNQDYVSAPAGGVAAYPKIPNIPAGYSIYSVDRTHLSPVNGGASDPIIAIPWDSTGDKPAATDGGIQMVALVIEHQGKVIATFTNNNDNWADGVPMTLQGYVRKS